MQHLSLKLLSEIVVSRRKVLKLSQAELSKRATVTIRRWMMWKRKYTQETCSEEINDKENKVLILRRLKYPKFIEYSGGLGPKKHLCRCW